MTPHIFADHLVDIAERLYVDTSLSYHNWGHIDAVGRAYKRLFGEAQSEERIAIAFHDCVYVPGAPAGVNEDLSILQMRRAFRETAKNYGGELPDIKLIELMIESTKVANHLSDAYMSVIEDDHGFDTAERVGRVLDCDLNGFAESYHGFVETQHDIIYEYAGYLTERELVDARKKSAEFLKQFLAKDRIYYSDKAYLAYEDIARFNIKTWAARNGV